MESQISASIFSLMPWEISSFFPPSISVKTKKMKSKGSNALAGKEFMKMADTLVAPPSNLVSLKIGIFSQQKKEKIRQHENGKRCLWIFRRQIEMQSLDHNFESRFIFYTDNFKEMSNAGVDEAKKLSEVLLSNSTLSHLKLGIFSFIDFFRI